VGSYNMGLGTRKGEGGGRKERTLREGCRRKSCAARSDRGPHSGEKGEKENSVLASNEKSPTEETYSTRSERACATRGRRREGRSFFHRREGSAGRWGRLKTGNLDSGSVEKNGRKKRDLPPQKQDETGRRGEKTCGTSLKKVLIRGGKK